MSIEMVQAFHLKFGLPDGVGPTEKMDDDMAQFRTIFLHEELEEFVMAHSGGDMVGAFDALLDLVYVAYGTALMMGISPRQWEDGFRAVQECNMTKIRAKSHDESKRGSVLDVVKPEGFVGPEAKLQEIINRDEKY